MLEGKNVLMVLAHPDDETIFGWPIFFNEKIKKTILICSTDRLNPSRQWCAHRVNVMANICSKENTTLHAIDNPSSFYRTPTRRPQGVPQTIEGDAKAPFRAMNENIIKAVNILQKDHDYIFTHNPFGEYGHIDHMLLFDLMLKNSKLPVVYTDIVQLSNWAGNDSQNIKPSIAWDVYYKNKIGSYKIDMKKYDSYKKIYQDAGCWTWDRELITECALYCLGKN